ncbi:MAG: glycosyltransferase family 4 protein [Candidatus Sumerlaeia bacterium]
MRILFVTNYYPPHFVGGYELHCGRVADWLAEQGHDVRILTGDFRRDDVEDDENPSQEKPRVYRDLTLRYWTDITDMGYWKREWQDLRIFRRHLAEFQPETVVLWNMRKLASSIVMEAQQSDCRLVYHLMDEWLSEFREANGLPQFWAKKPDSFWARMLKPPFRAIYHALYVPDVRDWNPQNAVFVSRALEGLVRKKGVEIPNRHISYITYDPADFAHIDWNRDNDPESPVRFLWAGRLCRGKGLVTTLDAIDMLYADQPEGWTIDFCGPLDTEDESGLFQPRLDKAPWKDKIRYLGSLPYSEMPRQYRDHDVFLFTSEVHEGLPGTIIEAFAAGLPVIGTLTGGTNDVLHPDENCLVYPIGDADALADAMKRLIENPELRRKLSAQTRQFAREQCSNTAVFPALLDFYKGGGKA